MESLSDTTWDVVICGTSLQQSLLALALSRSDQKILHLDPNDYYGGDEAAFSLQEADEWASKISEAGGLERRSIFSAVVIAKSEASGLSFPRAYSLALAPQIIHTRSNLISQLVSSRAYRQVEFLAVGSFFIFKPPPAEQTKPTLARIPSTREDVFSNTAIPARAKRQLMKFLKFVLDYESESQTDVWQLQAEESLVDFLGQQFSLDRELQMYILALTLSLDGKVTVKDGLAIIHKHLTSMGLFGPGFSALYPKWGGISEVAQVGCRAGAVGGATYMLNTGIEEVTTHQGENDDETELLLTNGVRLRTKKLVKGNDGTPKDGKRIAKLIAVVESPLSPIFEAVIEGTPTPAVAVVACPPGSVSQNDGTENAFPIYTMVHSSDTGECPARQCVLYLSMLAVHNSKAILEQYLTSLLSAIEDEQSAALLYQLYYEQAASLEESSSTERTFDFQPLPAELAFRDSTLETVHDAWKFVMGPTVAEDPDTEYMKFEDREGIGDDDDHFD